jgi:hypothetical protein
LIARGVQVHKYSRSMKPPAGVAIPYMQIHRPSIHPSIHQGRILY